MIRNTCDAFIQLEDPANALSKLAKQFGSEPCLTRIFQIVLSQGCKTIAVDDRYEDKEWGSEYALFYGQIFDKPSPFARRLHFFSRRVNCEDIHKLTDYQSGYLGFSVLRPLESQLVAGGVIRPVLDKNLPKKEFLLCVAEFTVDIEIEGGPVQRLMVEGFPLVQQDGQLGCCSHVALTMVDQFLMSTDYKPKRKEKSDEPYLIGDIVDVVSSVPEVQRLIPTEGLSALHISAVLKKMGYAPLVYEFGGDRERPITPDRIIYHYLESKIPIILGIRTGTGRHALTVIGHSFEPNLWWSLVERQYYDVRITGKDYHYSTGWLQSFIVQDDNFGPYLAIPKEVVWGLAKDELLIIVPLPLDVNIKGEDAESIAYSYIQMIVQGNDPWGLAEMQLRPSEEGDNSHGAHQRTKDCFKSFYEHSKSQDLVLRTWLLPTDEFRGSYPASRAREIYNNLRMPDRIWLTEISIPKMFCQTGLRIGEVLIDSTASKLRPCLLAMHLPGFIIVRDVGTGQIRATQLDYEGPFPHVIR